MVNISPWFRHRSYFSLPSLCWMSGGGTVVAFMVLSQEPSIRILSHNISDAYTISCGLQVTKEFLKRTWTWPNKTQNPYCKMAASYLIRKKHIFTCLQFSLGLLSSSQNQSLFAHSRIGVLFTALARERVGERERECVGVGVCVCERERRIFQLTSRLTNWKVFLP